jgi:hypothetical protein
MCARSPDRERCHNWRSTSVKYGAVANGYLRAAQAYMLISMPTGTSTIFGVFQAISAFLPEQDGGLPYRNKDRITPKIAQAGILRAQCPIL